VVDVCFAKGRSDIAHSGSSEQLEILHGELPLRFGDNDQPRYRPLATAAIMRICSDTEGQGMDWDCQLDPPSVVPRARGLLSSP
jgi:hypothetical protein